MLERASMRQNRKNSGRIMRKTFRAIAEGLKEEEDWAAVSTPIDTPPGLNSLSSMTMTGNVSKIRIFERRTYPQNVSKKHSVYKYASSRKI